MTSMAWNHRFQVDSDIPKIDLDAVVKANPELSSPKDSTIRIKQEQEGKPIAWRIPLDQMQRAEKLHIIMSLSGHSLSRGAHPWSKGIVLLDKGMPEHPESRRAVCAVMNDETTPPISQVIDMPNNNEPVALRIEHHGLAGEFEITRLEILGVKTSIAGQAAWIACCLCWMIWAVFLAGIKKPIRAILAGIIWIAFAWKIVLPGPWPTDHPIAGSFVQDYSPSTISSSTLKAAEVEPMVREPKNQSLLFYIKMKLPLMRPFLHGLLFGVPALLLMVCIPTSRAVVLSSALAAGVELVQIGFGYSFDWLDALDLLFDASGIIMAVVAHSCWQSWRARRHTT